MLLKWARVARRRRHGDGPAGERRRALAPHQRQELEGVLEQLVAAGDGREVPAVELVLAPEPRRAEATERAAARQHVEGGDDLGEVGDVAVRDAVDERAEASGGRGGGEEPERRRGLGDVLPLPADRRDLDEVVHHRDRREANLLGRAGDGAEARGELGGATGPRPAAELEAEAHRHGILPLATRRRRRVVERSGHDRDIVAIGHAVHASERLRRQRGDGSGQRLELAGDHRRRHRLGSRAVAGPSLTLRGVDDDGVAGDPGRRRKTPVAGAHSGIERRGVDHREQAAAQALADDQLEDLGGVLGRPQVVAVVSDDGAQIVSRDDGRRIEPPLGPRRLARPGDADQDDQARVWQTDAHGPHRRPAAATA